MINVKIFEPEVIDTRLQENFLQPFSEDCLPKYIDCGDERELTEIHQSQRDDLPARFFGAASGLAVVALNTVVLSSDTGASDVRKWLGQYEHGLADVAADLSNALYENYGISAHQHSCNTKEPDDEDISTESEEDLGCAFNAKLGIVLGQSERVQDVAGYVVSEHLGQSRASVNSTAEAIAVVNNILGGPDAKVSRRALVNVIQDPARSTPTALVQGQHYPADKAEVVLDLSGFKAKAFGKEFHHSVTLPELILPKAFPEFGFDDSELLRISSTIIGLSTQSALGVETTRIIQQ